MRTRFSIWAGVGMLFVFNLGVVPSARAVELLNEGFESVATLQANPNWRFVNLSTSASANLWRQGLTIANSIGPAPEGSGTSYALANYTDTASTSSTGATISNWMITPALTYTDGTTISFFTRTGPGAPFPDRLEVRLSTAGTSTDVGLTPTSVGDFTTVVLTVNPNLLSGPSNYPDTWTQYTATLSGLSAPTLGRIAFRYYVTDAGVSGRNSNIIGVDSFVVNSPAVVPETSTLSLILLSSLGVVRRVTRNRHAVTQTEARYSA